MSDYFPEEVIHEILLRLPVKSLIKCSTGVTKEVQELYSLHNPAIGESTMLIQPSSLVVPDDTPCPRLDVIGTCNGLICISSQYARKDVTILWNPCIRKFANLSRRRSTTSEIVYEVKFAFGYDARTNDYKVLKFTNFIFGFNLTNKVEVYSLARGCWRSLSAAVVADLASTGFMGVRNRVFLNGSLHWFENGAIWGFESFIVLFDMFSEEFLKMLVPPALAKERDPNVGIDISRHGESLAIVKIASSEDDNAIIHMWVMKEYGVTESWTELFTIRVEGYPRNFLKPYFFKPFGLRSGEIVLDVVGRGLLSVNPKSNQVKQIGLDGVDCYNFVDSFVESLVLLGQANAISY
ncbi:hypothetical protein M0R45_015191 [Rubus argutus]|uniref:F-box associated beta-propeller type 1 domain-containing protein n=1 Tax=Rubus argutus TaxID=59490 RepID=A0AAW1XNT2_RUBAR